MKIVCVKNMPYARDAFATMGETTVLEGRSIRHEDLLDIDILALRSTTTVNRDLLDGTPVKFVGTATIGTDHLDKDYLEGAGIRWCFSPGCNANSVSEYITAALLTLASRHSFTLANKTLGVIGVGNVGKRVVEKATALGLRVLKNDPPREDAEGPTGEFVPLEKILEEADIITMHVPITRDGLYPTHHMVNQGFLEKTKPGVIFLNAARGPVVDTDALIDAIRSHHVAHAVIDCWEGEPAFRADLLELVDIGTTHIAGHSFEGKVMGTVMVYREACRFLGIEPTWSPEALLPEPLVPNIALDASELTIEQALRQVVHCVYDIEDDDARLRDATTDLARHFDDIRKNYPVRREFRFTRVTLTGGSPALVDALTSLGFSVGQTTP